jgi:hypothetical protein
VARPAERASSYVRSGVARTWAMSAAERRGRLRRQPRPGGSGPPTRPSPWPEARRLPLPRRRAEVLALAEGGCARRARWPGRACPRAPRRGDAPRRPPRRSWRRRAKKLVHALRRSQASQRSGNHARRPKASLEKRGLASGTCLRSARRSAKYSSKVAEAASSVSAGARASAAAKTRSSDRPRGQCPWRGRSAASPCGRPRGGCARARR